MSTPDTTDLRFLGVAVSKYVRGDAWPSLPNATRDVRALALALASADGNPVLALDPTLSDILSVLRKLKAAETPAGWRGPMVVVWAGHGALDESLRLIARDTGAPPSELDSLEPSKLIAAALEAGADQLLVVLDTCHSGAGLATTAAKAIGALGKTSFPPGQETFVEIIASTNAYSSSSDERTVVALLGKLLKTGPEQLTPSWSEHERFIDVAEVKRAVSKEWNGAQQPQSVTVAGALVDRPFLPNPLYEEGAPARLVGQADEFIGRRGLLERMATWANVHPTGALALVGGAGKGKSTLLARFAALATPAGRAGLSHGYGTSETDPLPPQCDLVLADTARGRSLEETVAAIAGQLGIPGVTDIEVLVEELVRGEKRTLVALDGLDEARRGHLPSLVTTVVSRLATVTHVVVATRPIDVGTEEISEVLGRFAEVIDLDADPELEADLARFVIKLLEEPPDAPN